MEYTLKLVLPDGFVIETRTEDGGMVTFNIPAKHALKNGEKGLVTLKSPGGIMNGGSYCLYRAT